jgi:hypothetical protein
MKPHSTPSPALRFCTFAYAPLFQKGRDQVEERFALLD